MRYRGHINLDHLNDWHLNLNYELHYNPSDGFNLSVESDQHKYNNITVAVARELGPRAVDFFVNNFSFLTNTMICVQKMLPGMMLPTHTDKFTYYQKIYDVDNIDCIMRIIIFLGPWQPGHISEVNGEPNTLWKKGDWISWFGQTPHMAANIGTTDRYTLQITGLVKKPFTIS